MGTAGDRFLIPMDDQPDSQFRRIAITELNHFMELVSGVDVQQRERNRAGIEGFLGEAQHHCGVFADGIEHHRALEFAGDFAEDVYALRFQSFEIGKAGAQGVHRLHATTNSHLLIEIHIIDSLSPSGD